MSGRQSVAVARALALVRSGQTALEAARLEACDVRSVRRAMRAAGVPPGRPGRPPGAVNRRAEEAPSQS